MNFKSYVGIDVSKNQLDFAVLDLHGKLLKSSQFENTSAGRKAMLNWFKEHACLKDALFCLEHSGVYGLPLCVFLEENELAYSIQSGLQIKRSMGIRRGKSDRADAMAIARYAYRNRDEIECSKLPSRIIMKLKKLISYRERLIRAKVAIQTAAKEMKEFTDKGLHAEIVRDSQQHEKRLLKSIGEIDSKLKELIQSDEDLQRIFELATSVKGVGLQIAANLIVATHGFTRFSTWRKFSCYCALAPFEYRSGSSIRGKTRTSSLGNRRIKAIIGNGIASAIQHDPEIKQYYHRKLEEGKHKMVVMNAIKNKLVSRVFAVVKRGTPFVPLHQHLAA